MCCFGLPLLFLFGGGGGRDRWKMFSTARPVLNIDVRSLFPLYVLILQGVGRKEVSIKTSGKEKERIIVCSREVRAAASS